jgi:hypothetical protein
MYSHQQEQEADSTDHLDHIPRNPLQHLLHQDLRPPTLPPHTGTLVQISLELRSLGRNQRHYSILGRGHLQPLLHLRSSLGILDVL